MTHQALEYGFIRINNRRAVGLRPARHQELSAVIAPAALIGNVLANLRSAGWQLSSDNTFTGNETGYYELKVERPAQDDEINDPRFKYRIVKASEPFDDVQLDMQRRGWELLQVVRPIHDGELNLCFRGPKTPSITHTGLRFAR